MCKKGLLEELGWENASEFVAPGRVLGWKEAEVIIVPERG